MYVVSHFPQADGKQNAQKLFMTGGLKVKVRR